MKNYRYDYDRYYFDNYYRRPYDYYRPNNAVYDSQIALTNQLMYNYGYMNGVIQSSVTNQIRNRPYLY